MTIKIMLNLNNEPCLTVNAIAVLFAYLLTFTERRFYRSWTIRLQWMFLWLPVACSSTSGTCLGLWYTTHQLHSHNLPNTTNTRITTHSLLKQLTVETDAHDPLTSQMVHSTDTARTEWYLCCRFLKPNLDKLVLTYMYFFHICTPCPKKGSHQTFANNFLKS